MQYWYLEIHPPLNNGTDVDIFLVFLLNFVAIQRSSSRGHRNQVHDFESIIFDTQRRHYGLFGRNTLERELGILQGQVIGI